MMRQTFTYIANTLQNTFLRNVMSKNTHFTNTKKQIPSLRNSLWDPWGTTNEVTKFGLTIYVLYQVLRIDGQMNRQNDRQSNEVQGI